LAGCFAFLSPFGNVGGVDFGSGGIVPGIRGAGSGGTGGICPASVDARISASTERTIAIRVTLLLDISTLRPILRFNWFQTFYCELPIELV
jgi:hypothetical protein